MKKLIILILSVVTVIGLEAQQDAMYTHYMFNTQSINPAYAGSRDALTVTGLHRSQWISFPGAPTTQTLTGHTPILSDQMGVGLSIVNDKIGPTNTTSFYGDVAYRMKVNDNMKLAIGLKAGINMFAGDFNSLETDQANDQTFEEDLRSKIEPNFGIGLYLDAEDFYVGLSAPKLLENDFENSLNDSVLTQFSQQQHYYVIGGTVLSLNEELKLLPTAFLKITNGAPLEADITGRFLFDDKYWLGAMYRTGDAAGLLAGIQMNTQLALGYSFDFSFLNQTFKYNNGSHELMLRYDFIYKDKENILSPRYF